MKRIFTFLSLLLAVTALPAAPKKLLVVTTTTGFRHSSIPTAERIIAKLAKESREGFALMKVHISPAKTLTISLRSQGFAVDFVEQPPGHPTVGFPKQLKAAASPEEKQAFADADAKWNDSLKVALQKLSPENLKNYDGVIFASTTGDLPIPDKQGFLDWIKAGHAFIGIHAAADTFHGWPGYRDMLGGEFDHHSQQLSVDCLNQDPANPATASLPKVWTITQEEVYQFKNYDPAKVHELLVLDKKPEQPYTPGHFPVSWCKNYGAGKVFYTSLGHREDIWDADPKLPDRKNSVAISQAYQQHILGGIEWALGLKSGSAALP